MFLNIFFQITQMVHLLPHQRYDLYQKAVNILSSMAETLQDFGVCCDAVNCHEKEKRGETSTCEPLLPDDHKEVHNKCLWKRNHASKASLKQSNTIMKLSVTEI